ncbi:MAG: hypothetical protein QXY83_05820 [Thermosphaera sp.]
MAHHPDFDQVLEQGEVYKPIAELQKTAVLELEQLLDVARCVFTGSSVDPKYLQALRDYLKDKVFENREVAKAWERKLQSDPDADVNAWIADTPLPAREFLRQLIDTLEQAEVRFAILPAHGDTAYVYRYTLNVKLELGADVNIMRTAARIIGKKGLGFSQEIVRRLLQQTAQFVEYGELDPPGYLCQADGTVLDPQQLRVYDRVDAFFENSLGTAVSNKDLDVIKSLINAGYEWGEAEDIILQNYAPNFAKVVENIFRTERERAQFRECVGSIFFPGVLRAAFIIRGDPNIGKSVIVDTLMDVLGDYAASKPWSSILGEEGEKHIGGLKGKYANIVSESPKYMVKNIELFKRLTGDVWIEGRKLFVNFFKFMNMCKHIVFCNRIPTFSEIEEAVVDRLYVIEPSGEPLADPDTMLREKARREVKGVLMWILTNYAYFARSGYRFKHKPDPEYVERLLIAARSNVFAFVEELFTRGVGGYIAEVAKGSRVKGSQLRELYVQWCNERGEEAFGTAKFYEDFAAAAAAHGVTKAYGRGEAVVFLNMRLLPLMKGKSHLFDL